MKFVKGPAVVLDPSGRAPLAGSVSFATDVPTRAAVDFSDSAHDWTAPARNDFATEHEILVLGMRPASRTRVRVTACDANGQTIEAPEPLEIRTEPLPAMFPPIEIRHSEPSRREPGISLFTLRKG